MPEKKSNIFVVGLDVEDGQFKLAEEPRNLLVGSGLVSGYDFKEEATKDPYPFLCVYRNVLNLA